MTDCYIQPNLTRLWFGYSFDSGDSSYRSLKNCKLAATHFGKTYEEIPMDDVMLRIIERLLVYYDLVYRGSYQEELETWRCKLEIPEEYPTTCEDKDYNCMFKGLSNYYPNHWIVQAVEITEDLITKNLKM